VLDRHQVVDGREFDALDLEQDLERGASDAPEPVDSDLRHSARPFALDPCVPFARSTTGAVIPAAGTGPRAARAGDWQVLAPSCVPPSTRRESGSPVRRRIGDAR